MYIFFNTPIFISEACVLYSVVWQKPNGESGDVCSAAVSHTEQVTSDRPRARRRDLEPFSYVFLWGMDTANPAAARSATSDEHAVWHLARAAAAKTPQLMCRLSADVAWSSTYPIQTRRARYVQTDSPSQYFCVVGAWRTQLSGYSVCTAEREHVVLVYWRTLLLHLQNPSVSSLKSELMHPPSSRAKVQANSCEYLTRAWTVRQRSRGNQCRPTMCFLHTRIWSHKPHAGPL